jgi:hypothetical protein
MRTIYRSALTTGVIVTLSGIAWALPSAVPASGALPGLSRTACG